MNRKLIALGFAMIMSMSVNCYAEYEGNYDDEDETPRQTISNDAQKEEETNQNVAAAAHDEMSKANDVLAKGISDELAEVDALTEYQIDSYFDARLDAGIDGNEDDEDPAGYITTHSGSDYSKSQ